MKNIHILPTDKPSILHLYTDENGTRLETFEVEYSHTRDTQHIYITSDEEIKDGDWYLDTFNNQRIKANEFSDHKHYGNACKKIILTTDQDLITDGVQAIDDKFLEWFVNNSSCESVEVVKDGLKVKEGGIQELMEDEYYQKFPEELPNCVFIDKYEIIIPQEEPKQETLEEVQLAILFHNTYENLAPNFGYETRADTKSFETTTPNGMLMIAVCKEIIKWQQERSYSEEEVKEIIKLSCEKGMLIQRTINDKVKIPYMRIKDFTIRMFEQYKKK
jgi:hypothetical protein